MEISTQAEAILLIPNHENLGFTLRCMLGITKN